MIVTGTSDKHWIKMAFPSLVAACAAVALASTVAGAALSKQEQKCVGKLGKSAIKVATTYAKGAGKCLDADISQKTVGACPDAKTIGSTAKVAGKVISTAEKLCSSTCSTLDALSCVSDLQCPPPFGACNAGAKSIPFSAGNINFPGLYCGTVGVPTISSPTDIGTCTSDLASQSGLDLVATIYGSITSASSITAGAASCLAKISKPTQKLTATVAKAVLKCRDGINKGKLLIEPEACEADQKTADKIAKAAAKLTGAIADNCDDPQIQELDLCGNGVGVTASVAEAQTCLVANAKEIANSNAAPVDRNATAVTIIEAAMPPAASTATCGDNIVNGIRNDAQPFGEECDGTDDSECPGLCLPPGDLFQCTCSNRPRWRFEADAASTDSDAG